ncbi:MAG TPA: hypothetical protein VK427_26020, partial [Kofleriaceae bacterium]|nr:hypothetical protein [Kofleriaceae bacterium]
MWRSVATCAFTLGACASAEPPGEIMDASSDAPRPRDAAIDARPIDAMMNLCPSTDTCAGATMLGTVSGDLTSAKLTASGYRAAWFRVRVTENDDNVPGLKLRVASKLTFPATVGFETFVYV